MTGSWEFEKTSFNDNYVITTSSWYYKHCGNGSCGRIVIEQEREEASEQEGEDE